MVFEVLGPLIGYHFLQFVFAVFLVWSLDMVPNLYYTLILRPFQLE